MKKLLQHISLMMALGGLSILSLRAQEILPNTWVPNGPINAITRQGDIVYVGGEFTQVGLPLPHGALFNRTNGHAIVSEEKLDGPVTHAMSDGQGGFFLSTTYMPNGGSNYRFVAHVLPNGTISESFNPNIPGNTQIKVIAATQDRVLIRTRYGSPTVHALYCVGYDGTLYWTRTANGRILNAISSIGTFYIVGNFTSVEGQPRTRTAALNAYTGELLSWNTGDLIPALSDPLALYQSSVSLGISGNELFIRWRALSNVDPNSRVASVDLQTGTPTGWSLPISYSGTPGAPMAVHNGRVYLATATGQGLLILDATSKQVLPNPTGILVNYPSSSVNRITSIVGYDQSIYLGGGRKVDSNGADLPDVVSMNVNTLEREALNINILSGVANSTSAIYNLAASADGIFVGGSFPAVESQARTNLYAFNTSTGELLPFAAEFAPDQYVTHLFATDSRLYTAGLFYSVNGQPREYGIASFDLTTGNLSDWNPVVDDPGAYPTLSLYGYGNRIYVLGAITIAGGAPRNGVAAFDASSGDLIQDWSPSGFGAVVTMTANETGVFLAGRNTENNANIIALVDLVTGARLTSDLAYGGGDGTNAILTMSANDSHLYIGGDFTTLASGSNQYSRPNFAAINITSGQVEDVTLNLATGSFGSPSLSALAATNSTVYLGGTFGLVNSVPRQKLAAISAETGELTDWKFKDIDLYSGGATGRSLRTIQVGDNGVLVGGEFDRVNLYNYINNLMRVSPDRSNVVTGRVYYDINQNGIQDAGEAGVPNLLVELQPGNIFYPTDANGHYTVFTGIGNYTVRPVHPTYAISVLPNQRQLSFTDDLQVSVNNDFGVAIFPSITDVSVSVSTDQTPRPGFYFNYIVTYTNHGTMPASGSVQLTYDPRLLFQSSSVNPIAVAGNQLTYNFTQVEAGESQVITLNLRVPVPTVSGSMLGEHIVAQATVTTTANDQNPADNQATLEQTIVGSVDPNDKLVTPQGFGPNGYIAVNTDHLEYTIRFQNVGTAPATFVTLEDVLDPNLNISTFTVVSASHAYTYQIVDRTLSVLFDNINLIDSLTDEPNSHGYFTFTIGLNDNLPVGTQIQNTASIVFDYNLPLETNTVTNTLRNPPYETTIFLPDSTGMINEEVIIPVFANDWEDMLGAQFSVYWDPAVASFLGVESLGLPGLDVGSFNLSTADNGYFSFAWSDPAVTPQTLPDGTALFHIRFRLTGDFGATTAVGIVNYPVAIEAIAADYQAIDVQRIEGRLTIDANITIQGTIQYPNQQAVQNVTVSLAGSAPSQTATNSEGHFEFTFQPAAPAETLSLTPSKENDPNLLNGIDVQDVASIRRHILRTELLNSPYSLIAADVSNNSMVSIQDAVLLQALILGVETDWPNGRQWTFVDASYNFPNATSPFPYPTNTSVDLAELTQEDQFNFTAVKLGDVTFDRDNAQTGRTQLQEVVLEIGQLQQIDSDLYEVTVSTKNFTEVAAYQFTISWDQEKLEFVSVHDNDLIKAVFGTHRTMEGFVTAIWDDAAGQSISLPDHSDLFKIRFRSLKTDAGAQLEIDGKKTPIKMYDANLSAMKVRTQYTEGTKQFSAVYPNPFDNKVTVSYSVAEQQAIKIVIFNSIGQLVHESTHDAQKGWNKLTMDTGSMDHGIYLLTVQTNEKRETTKVAKR